MESPGITACKIDPSYKMWSYGQQSTRNDNHIYGLSEQSGLRNVYEKLAKAIVVYNSVVFPKCMMK